MALVRLDPARELDTLQGEMNRLFSTFFDTPTARREGDGNGVARRWIPAMDLVETDEQFVLTADLPGLKHDDVDIELENNVLTIAGARAADSEPDAKGYYRLERARGSFSRSIALPDGIDPDAVTANFDAGVLTVRIPKPVEAKPRRVRIDVGDAGSATIDAG